MDNDVLRRFLAKRLRELRKKMGMTQSELAKKARISLYYVQLLEGSRTMNPSISVLTRIADAFDLLLWQLLKFDEEDITAKGAERKSYA
ncbi:MAG: helix-turn-helix transcriptional regulator [Candidatus Peribacteraceae bacterium]|nr:helix-turn-helix transcriptional regulator [Candidatus Peribacteraceae bacterium]